MLSRPGKRINTTEIFVEPNEGERQLLPGSKSGMRSPSLDLSTNISEEENLLLKELAEILLEAILFKIKNGSSN